MSAHRRARPTGSASGGPRWSISSGAAAPSQTGQQPMGRNSATGGHQIMGGVRQMLAMGASGHRLHAPGRGGRLDASSRRAFRRWHQHRDGFVVRRGLRPLLRRKNHRRLDASVCEVLGVTRLGFGRGHQGPPGALPGAFGYRETGAMRLLSTAAVRKAGEGVLVPKGRGGHRLCPYCAAAALQTAAV